MCWFSLTLDTVTAVGTLVAAVIALWLGLRDNRPRINGVFIWSAATEGRPTLLIQNIGNKIAVIESIEAYYNKQQVCEICCSSEETLRDFSIIEAGSVKIVPLNPDWLHIEPPSNKKKSYILKVIIKPRTGRKGVSKQKYTFNELAALLFEAYFNDNDK